jgi:SPP1 family predicted phage head-tail adaptor
MAKCCDIKAGMLTTPVAFQRKSRTRNQSGGFVDTWAPLSGSATRAHVKALSGFERLQADRVNAETKERLVCRYFPGLRPDDRVIIEGRAYNIRWVNDVERRKRWYELDLSGGVAAS